MTTELAVLFPIVLASVLGLVQMVLWAHANHVAQAAADHGAEVVAAFDGSESDGVSAAAGFLDEAGLVDRGEITARRSPRNATVEVHGSFPSVFGRLEVEAKATVVLELPRP